jgi:hypothetical protein
MTRSEQLDRVARLCSLGGDEKATEELDYTRIMFGQIIGEDQAGSRVGFGLEDETIP